MVQVHFFSGETSYIYGQFFFPLRGALHYDHLTYMVCTVTVARKVRS